jgi:(2Fe-2S) ferredoxin
MKILFAFMFIAGLFSSAGAAVFNVSNLNDAGPGSLRQAIIDANIAPGDDTIVFQTSGTIQLTSGELAINSNITINGVGVSDLTINGNGAFRIFNIAPGVIANIYNLTLRGNLPTGGLGGGILNAGALSALNLGIVGCRAGNDGRGIGIANTGTMTLVNSTVMDNAGTPSLGPFLGGGGIYNSGSMQIINSNISLNLARFGGGIYNEGTLTAKNTTLYGNKTQGGGNSGGGITQAATGSLTLTNCTITASFSSSDVSSGILNQSNTPVSLYNTIVAGNYISTPTMRIRDVWGTVASQGNNLISEPSGSNGWIASDLLNRDPRLTALNSFGGITLTVALMPGSPAIDAGGPVDLATDQRGFPRPVDLPYAPNTPGGNGTDIGAFEKQVFDLPRRAQFDFDGDGRADISVFRPTDRNWYLIRSGSGITATQFGLSSDKIAPADFDGDGRADFAVFRDGAWYWLASFDNSFHAYQFGTASDIPVPSDYTGDGRAELAVYRAGAWYLLDLASNQFQSIPFGVSSDKPVPADFDGDGKTDLAVYRSGVWYWLRSSDNGFRAVQFGIASDKPVVGDYDGDLKADPAVYRNGIWYVSGSSQGAFPVQFGVSTDIPVPADYDGDGKTDIAVYRDGVWYFLYSAQGFGSVNFGVTSDKPIPAAFVP